MNQDTIRLTQYSHGAGCGCKISPQVLDAILHSEQAIPHDPRLLVGNETRDDAAVYDLGNGQAVISTTDFFMPIVDDPFDFGRIAATNAISDIWAMGGKPIMAIAILGWPVNVLLPEVARRVIEGGRSVCQKAGIALAGGHSIDAPEPIFGLAATGTVDVSRIKKNSAAEAGCRLWLSKPLGTGVLTTAEKKGLLRTEHRGLATEVMCQLNSLGEDAGMIEGVKAMTDVTGFGFLGHLNEMCQGAALQARIHFSAIPRLPGVEEYIAAGCVPGGSARNVASYGQYISPLTPLQRDLLCDPQTSGGLLLAVTSDAETALLSAAERRGVTLHQVGELIHAQSGRATIHIQP